MIKTVLFSQKEAGRKQQNIKRNTKKNKVKDK
jgi:hypothetical protein